MSPCFLLNKNINFNKNETASKLENPTNFFTETNLVLQLIKESQIKSKTVMSWSSQKKKQCSFCNYFVYFLLAFKVVESLQCIFKNFANFTGKHMCRSLL